MDDPAVYEELYHYEDGRKLVINKDTQDVLMMKRITHYDEDVFTYLRDNPNEHIPKIRDIIRTDDGLLVTEDQVHGVTFDVIIDDMQMSFKKKISYFYQLLDGLAFLHSAPKPIIHRDLKPSNIMVNDRDQVIIIDYDAAKIYKPDQEDDTVNLGTDGWAAPEQYGFRQSDPRTDIYAVGKMLQKAFPDNRKVQKIASVAESFDPDKRYENVSQLKDALKGRLKLNSRIKPLLPPPGFRTRKWWKMLIAVIVYPFFILLVGGSTSVDGGLADVIYSKILFASIFLVALDICFSWTGIYDILPFMNHKNVFVRILVRIIYAFLSVILVTVIISLIYSGITAFYTTVGSL